MSVSVTLPPSRLTSLDQFRGYTVSGMVLVNLLAPFAAIHPLLKHNQTYFSYADSIMPSFLFVVGFAFRMSYVRRQRSASDAFSNWHYVRRCLVLVLFGLLIYGFTGSIDRWFQFREMPIEMRTPRPAPSQNWDIAKELPSANDDVRDWHSLGLPAMLFRHWRILAAKLLKSEIWGTLSIIGVTQLAILPWIGCRFGVRFVVLIAFGLSHAILSYWFNWEFVHGVAGNWMSQLWMTGTDRSWDGGFFGFLSWGVVMLAGTLACDLVAGAPNYGIAAWRMIGWACTFMIVGYAMSCLSRLYDLNEADLSKLRTLQAKQVAEKAELDRLIKQQQERIDMLRERESFSGVFSAEMAPAEAMLLMFQDVRARYPDLELANDPVLPRWDRLRDRSPASLLAEPPFVAPPEDDSSAELPPMRRRLENYWMMGKRMPTLSFMTFATGFAFAAYGLFVLLCDLGNLSVGLFRTFGTNALAAYFVHGAIGLLLTFTVPHNAMLGVCLSAVAIGFLVTYLAVHALEKRGLYWKL